MASEGGAGLADAGGEGAAGLADAGGLAVTGPVSRQVLHLSDGRALGFAEWGDPRGAAVLDFHGNPGCRFSAWGDEAAIATAGVRLITVDRPGIGLSDPLPGRRVVDWAADVRELADGLLLERFAVLGHSVGGAYAAACAARLPDRVTVAALVSSIAPLDRPGAVRELGHEMQWRLAQWAPWALRGAYRAAGVLAGFQPGAVGRLHALRLTREERDLVRRANIADRAGPIFAEATRQGPAGLAEDLRAALRPWGFSLAEIGVPTHIWQGDRDSSIPRRWGEDLAEAIPGAVLHACPGEGHLLIEERIGEILKILKAEGG